ncbi:MAG: OsmC family protein [Paludibacterium sp.]|uniref:OsmC family protein n=1 Tax=Paludibacterium sp. TaxID=1917523 RepID=UPI0025D13A25|nr:OsmC family protein [Paludibacterium sp.]MBV8049248.1 OsmC family protein [Paludibacterium sp.]MBV8648262.1 OsmC family protein [Paludibacterium sp.]
MTIVIERDLSAPMRHTVQIGQHRLVVDMGEAEGGSGSGPNPHDLYDAALGACKALTMLWYAQRKNIDVGDIRVTVARDDSQESQGTYRLQARIALDPSLDDATRQKLMAIADRCPVHKLMTQVTTVIDTVAEV